MLNGSGRDKGVFTISVNGGWEGGFMANKTVLVKKISCGQEASSIRWQPA